MKTLLGRIKNSYLFSSLRRGLMMTFPIVFIGCLACVLANIPIEGYDEWISSFCGGFFKTLFSILNNACVGCVALWMMCFVSYSYGEFVSRRNAVYYTVASICCYVIFVFDSKSKESMIERFGSRWTFTAIVVTVLACVILRKLLSFMPEEKMHIYTSGSDKTFFSALRYMIPLAETLIIFGILRAGIQTAFPGTDYYDIGKQLANKLFEHVNNDYLIGLLFVTIVHILWFFGIHGSDMLENVAQVLEGRFASGVICTKTFVDTYVLIGGCGVSLCILISILIASRSDRNKRLARFSLFPGIFNINESVIYGLPVFFNPMLAIPFILVPAVNYTVSYWASFFGIVAPIVNHVTWQMPMVFSGYIATGSVSGSILQIFNVLLGTLIYIPFIKRMEISKEKEFNENIQKTVELVKSAESEGKPPKLLSGDNVVNDTARGIAEDLRYVLKSAPETLELFYQPQVDYYGNVFGVEALLRWHHPSAGYLYPPLVIALASEMKIIDELGILLIEKAASELEKLNQDIKTPISLAVNITAQQLESSSFADSVKAIIERHNFGESKLVFELTEQISLNDKPEVNIQLARICEMGIELSLDDFGMGHSSLVYLQKHSFKHVKLDGSLVRNIIDNDMSKKIVTSMTDFAKNANVTIIAEFLETAEQREALHKIGCDCYQGYFYSKPLPEKDILNYIISTRKEEVTV